MPRLPVEFIPRFIGGSQAPTSTSIFLRPVWRARETVSQYYCKPQWCCTTPPPSPIVFTMASHWRTANDWFLATMRKIYNPIGFSKGYNFVLWFISSCAMMGFCLARLMYLNYDGVYCPRGDGVQGEAVPGECWTYDSKTYLLLGIKMHLYCIIPASFLACFQFLPIIRHRFSLVHRINGYFVLLLSGPGAVGCVMVSRHAFGGGVDIQVVVGLMSIMFLGALGIALYNVKMLQLEQHRAWMLRAWFYVRFLLRETLCSLGRSLELTFRSGCGYHYLSLHLGACIHHHLDAFYVPILLCQALRSYGHLLQRHRCANGQVSGVCATRRMGGRQGRRHWQ